MNNNNNKPNTLKRRTESNNDDTKRQRPKLDMNRPPTIPVRPTLASRSNTSSPTTNPNHKRFSNASTSSNRSSSSSTTSIKPIISTSNGVKRPATAMRKPTPSSSSNTTNGIVRKSTTPPSTAGPSRKSTTSPSAAGSSSRKSTTPPSAAGSRKPTTIAKIPKWDSKGQMNHLQSKLEETGEEVSQIEKLHDDLQTTVQSTEFNLQEAMQKVTDLENTVQATKDRHAEEIKKHQDKFATKNRELIFENEKHKSKLDGQDKELHDLQAQYTNTTSICEVEKRENVTLKATLEKTTASYSEVDAELRHAKMKFKSAGSALADHENFIQELTTALKDKEATAKGLEKKLLDEEKQRRKLHNTIQELKGNIRVFCRVRPSTESNEEENLAKIRFFGDDQEKMELSEQISSTLGKSSTRSHQFSFDRVFSPNASQKDCFEEISQLVQSALDGYNVCIFAYGQTGSGKTFTMQGPDNVTEATVGMIPRAVQQIYDVAQQLKQFGWKYSMQGQFLEIYNETIHDLLGDVSSFGKIKHEIHHEKNGKTTVTDMTTVTLDSPSKVKMMLRKASQNRATGATNLNERSSRSHSVFTLKLTGHNIQTGERTTGLLNLIDLAGSERLSMSGSVGDRLRETQNINKSLSSLGDVIQALVNNNNKEGAHIPYRNSKLTYLLRNSLGGNCKTLMFVNVSPMMEHFNETLCSLRFATKVNSCQIGTAKKTIK